MCDDFVRCECVFIYPNVPISSDIVSMDVFTPNIRGMKSNADSVRRVHVCTLSKSKLMSVPTQCSAVRIMNEMRFPSLSLTLPNLIRVILCIYCHNEILISNVFFFSMDCSWIFFKYWRLFVKNPPCDLHRTIIWRKF